MGKIKSTWISYSTISIFHGTIPPVGILTGGIWSFDIFDNRLGFVGDADSFWYHSSSPSSRDLFSAILLAGIGSSGWTDSWYVPIAQRPAL